MKTRSTNEGEMTEGQFFKQCREAVKKSQAFVAEKIKCSPQFVSKIETGKASVPVEDITSLAKIFKIKPEALEEYRIAEYARFVRSHRKKSGNGS